jgi:hypothetical protein
VVDGVFVSYLGSWSPAVGAALFWLTAELSLQVAVNASLSMRSPTLLLNVSTPRVYDSHWTQAQTTATVKDLQLYAPHRLLAEALAGGWSGEAVAASLSACLSKSSGCSVLPRFQSLTLLVLTLSDNRTFSFVGLFVRVRQTGDEEHAARPT